jgi:hypothetical protein
MRNYLLRAFHGWIAYPKAPVGGCLLADKRLTGCGQAGREIINLVGKAG